MTSARLASVVLLLAGGAAAHAGPRASPPGQEPEAPAAPASSVAGATPGAPTMSLATAVRTALAQGFALLDSRDTVSASRWREKAAVAEFYPSVTPIYQRGEGRDVFGVDLAQRLPWTGGTLTATGRYLSEPTADAP